MIIKYNYKILNSRKSKRGASMLVPRPLLRAYANCQSAGTKIIVKIFKTLIF